MKDISQMYLMGWARGRRLGEGAVVSTGTVCSGGWTHCISAAGGVCWSEDRRYSGDAAGNTGWGLTDTHNYDNMKLSHCAIG